MSRPRALGALALALLLGLLLSLAPAASAQDGWGFGTAQGTRGGFGPAQGTSAAAPEEPAWSPEDMAGVVAFYDPGDATTLIRGGADLAPADDDFYARTSGALPLISSGTPTYPISIVCWFKTDTTAATQGTLVSLSDGSTSEILTLYRSSGAIAIYAASGGGNSNSATSSALTAGRWHCVVAVYVSASSRAIYLDTDTTGVTDTAASRAVSGIDNLHVGRQVDGSSEFDGVVAYTAVLPINLSGAGNASIRTAIFSGADPETASSTTATALWKFDNDNGADSRGSFDLTASGTPVAQNNLIVMRDKVGTAHVRATTSAPTYDASLYSNRGGVTFTAASSQFLVCESAPITAAPMQVYAVARTSSTTALQSVVWIGDKDTAINYWSLNFAGATGGDPAQWQARDNGTGAVGADSSTGYSANTTHLLWGMEASTTSRAARIDGASEGTGTDSQTPAGADRIAVGIFAGSTPSGPLNGSIGAVWLLNTADVTERPDAHTWVNTEFGTSIP